MNELYVSGVLWVELSTYIYDFLRMHVLAWTYCHNNNHNNHPDYYATIEVTLHMYKRFKDLISK